MWCILTVPQGSLLRMVVFLLLLYGLSSTVEVRVCYSRSFQSISLGMPFFRGLTGGQATFRSSQSDSF